MQVIDRTQTNNTLNFIPKSYNPTGANIFKVVIKNEDQNKEVHSTTVSSYLHGSLTARPSKRFHILTRNNQHSNGINTVQR